MKIDRARELLDEFLLDKTLQGCSPRTIELYRYIIQKYLHFVEKQETDDVTEYVREYIAYMRLERGTSQNYCATISTILRTYLSFCGVDTSSIPMLKRQKQLPRALTGEEVEAFLKGQDKILKNSKRNKLIINLFLSTGIRVSELIGIRLEDIDRSARSIRVLGKGNKIRTVLYNKETSLLLKEYLSRLSDNQVYLFENKYGNPFCVKTIQTIVKKQGMSAGLKRTVTPHMLRHTFATQLLLKGCNIKAIQQLMGHESLETTQIYTKLGFGEVKDAYDRASEERSPRRKVHIRERP